MRMCPYKVEPSLGQPDSCVPSWLGWESGQHCPNVLKKVKFNMNASGTTHAHPPPSK